MSVLPRLREALLADPATWGAALAEIDEALAVGIGPGDPPGRVARRLLVALAATGRWRATGADLAPLVRHVIRVHRQALAFPREVYTRFADSVERSGLVGREADGRVTVTADPWSPGWLPDAEWIDVLELRRTGPSAAGDGMVQRVLGQATYQSEAQKAAVLAAAHAPPGSTTLVTLPTGAGKSLCALLPAWVESGGGRGGATTILVVPTVALAHDQLRQARRIFPAGDEPSRPQAWLGETTFEQRGLILDAVRQGRLPLLITSPEALMESGALRLACEAAAAADSLVRVVVDEAHLVETWGAGFRTDFQAMGGLHRRLLAASRGELRLVLLSATMSEECEGLLRRLFGGGASFRVVRANRLRPEPAYWFSLSDDLHTRRRRVLEALRYLPRPAIVYVTQPEVAQGWVRSLRAEGYARVAAFTGETTGDDRLSLARAWQADQIDLMVATSAFGLGIDKADVRAIVHAALPETVDRFYQEVGRAGRDGWSSVSLTCVEPGDVRVPEAMMRGSVISTEKGVDRITGMMRTIAYRPDSGRVGLVDMDARPAAQPDLRQGERNREWNEHTLLLAQRAGLLAVLDSHPIEAWPADGPARRLREIDVLDDAALRAPETILTARFEAARSAERQRIMGTIAEVDEVARHYAAGGDRCLATRLARLYPDCALACGGCPVCRSAGQEPYVETSDIVLNGVGHGSGPLHAVHPGLLARTGPEGLIAYWDGRRHTAELRGLQPLLTRLVRAGFVQVVLADDLAADAAWVARFAESLVDPRVDAHAVLTASWAADRLSRPLFRLPTVVVYPPDDAGAGALYRGIKARQELQGMPGISVVHQDLEIQALGGRFRDKVDGLTVRVGTLVRWLDDLRIRVSA